MALELLERYLHAVKPLLPRKTQDDILRELSDDILSQMEERGDALGRNLTEAEQEEVIKKHGHPVIVAARYGRQQYLIGPAVFPVYWLILRIAAAGGLLVSCITAVAKILLSPNPAQMIAPALLAVPLVLLPVFGWVTGVFAVYELCSSLFDIHVKTNWSVRQLPAVKKHTAAVPRLESVATIVFGSAGVFFWWLAVTNAPYLVLGPAASVIRLGPIWTDLLWPILILALAGVLQAMINLVRPQLTRARIALRLLVNAYGLAILCLILRGGNWIVVAPTAIETGRLTQVVGITNQALFYCFLLGVVFAGIRLVWDCVRYFRGPMWRDRVHHAAVC